MKRRRRQEDQEKVRGDPRRGVKSVGSTPVQRVDHLVPLCSGTFSFLSLGLELSRDLPPWSVFSLTTLAGLSGM